MNDPHSALGDLALAKLSRVLGASLAIEELSAALHAVGIDAIRTVDDLEKVADALKTRPGFVATVGAMLSVEAAMRRLGGR